MSFDYQSQTKHAYQDRRVADEYHASFDGPLTWRTLRFKYIARRERKVVGGFLRALPARTLLDLPCGTGKLAPVFAQGSYRIQAADISDEMMAIAADSYARAGLTQATFQPCDAEEIGRQFPPHSIDVAVCLRLMHRVPADTRRNILRQMALTARHVIISYAVDSAFHRFRRRLRNLLFGTRQQTTCTASLRSIQAELDPQFKIMESSWVARFFSEEIVFLLESRPDAPVAVPANAVAS